MKFISPKNARPALSRTPSPSPTLPMVSIRNISISKPSILVDSTRGETTCNVETITEYSAARQSSEMGIVVIQSSDPIITRVIRQLGEKLLRKIGPSNNWKGNAEFDDMLIDAGAPEDRLTSFKDTNIYTMTCGIYDNINRSLVQDNKIPHNFTFPLASKAPSHLTYFSLCYLMDRVTQQPNAIVKNDTVFENRTIPSTTFFYKGNDGNYWSGPVKKEGAVYVADNPSKTKLTVQRTTNAKIVDFRSIEEVSKVDVMKDLQNEKLKSEKKEVTPAIRKLDPATANPHPYVSDIFPSLDYSRNVRFSFMINFEDLVFNNSDFGKTYRTEYDDLRKELINSSRIHEIKVWSQAIKKAPGSLGYINEKNTVPTLVAESGQGINKKFVANSASIREKKLSAVPLGVRTFDVLDSSVGKSSRSLYRYWVEIVLADGTKKFFNNRVVRLKSFLSTLDSYSQDISKNILKARPRIPANQNLPKVEGLNPLLNRLTDNFADKMRDRYWRKINQGKENYLKTLSLFTSLSDGFDVSRVNNLLINLLDPNTTNLDNINVVLKMVNDLIAQVLSAVPHAAYDPNNLPKGVRIGGTTKRVIKNFNTHVDFAEHDLGGIEFVEFGATSEQKNANYFGLREYSGQQFLNRLQTETLKYYVNDTPNLGLDRSQKNRKSSRSTGRMSRTAPTQKTSYKTNLYGYLSPSKIVYGSPRASFTSIDVTGEQTEAVMRLVENRLKANRKHFEATGFPLPEDERFLELIKDLQSDNPRFSSDYMQNFILQSVGVGETGRDFSSLIKKVSCDIENSDDIERRDQFATDQPNDLSAAGRMPSSLAQFVSRSSGKNRGKYRNLGKKRESKNSLARMANEELESLPNQVTAFYLSNSSNPQDVRLTNNSEIDLINDSRYSSTSLFNYRLIVELQYLSGFERSSKGKFMMSSPVWEKLDAETYSLFSGKSILCRLVKYTDSKPAQDLDAWPEEMNVTIHNEHFYLKPESPIGSPASRPALANQKISFPDTIIADNPFRRNLESGTTNLDATIPPIRQKSAIRKLNGLSKMSKKLKDSTRKDQKNIKSEYEEVILSLKDKAARGILAKSDVRKLDKFKSMLSKDPSEVRNFSDIKKKLEQTIEDDVPEQEELSRSRAISPSKELSKPQPIQKTKKTSSKRVSKSSVNSSSSRGRTYPTKINRVNKRRK